MNRFSFRKTTAIILSISFLTSMTRAQEELTLNEVLYETIGSNLTLKVNSFGRYLSEQDVIIARSVFDSSIYGGLQMSKTEQDATLSRSEAKQAYAGVSKSFSTGTSVTLQTNYYGNEGSRFDSDLNQIVGGSTSHNAGIELSIRQPLLRGFGKSANMANIWKAESQLEVARLEYKNWILDIVNLTEKSYWMLAFQNARLGLSQTSVDVAESLLSETEQRAEVGLATRLDVLQAKANLATQHELFIDAERSVQDAADQLLTHMGRLTPDYQDTGVSVGSLPELSAEMPPLAGVWSGALATDLDTRIQRTNMDSLNFNKILAKDQLKTNLDLVLSGATTGLSSDSSGDAFSSALEKQGYDWGIGLEVRVPLGKRSAKSQLNKIEVIMQREQLMLDVMEQSLFQSVRRQWRTLAVSLEKLKATRATLELEEQAFEQAQAKYSNGLAVFRDVQEAQSFLNRARISELNAWITALQAEANLSRLDGTQLDRLQINVNFE